MKAKYTSIAQLSQRDRAAECVSFWPKVEGWNGETLFCRQREKQNKGYYAVHDHSRSPMSYCRYQSKARNAKLTLALTKHTRAGFSTKSATEFDRS